MKKLYPARVDDKGKLLPSCVDTSTSTPVTKYGKTDCDKVIEAWAIKVGTPVPLCADTTKCNAAIKCYT